MFDDRYGLALSTASTAARNAYVRGHDLALTFYPGALEAFDLAIAADPGFAMAYAAKAQVLMRAGEAAAAWAALQAADALTAGLTAREASHIAYFGLAFSGMTQEAIAAARAHLQAWPRDALVVASAANPNGLIGGSGQIGQKRQIAELMDSLAPAYGEDFWFLSYHAMALSEDGRLKAARPMIERSVALNPNNAHGAHGYAHVCYESGDLDSARAFLSSWLATSPREGFFHGHLSWHHSLFELQAGNWAGASHLFHDAIAPERHSGGPQQKLSDPVAFLWRSELAGHPRDHAAWRTMHEYAGHALPRAGSGLADLHVILAQAVMGDAAALDARTRQMETMAREGRYPSGSYLPALSRGFAAFEQGDFPTAIAVLAPLAEESERIGGSRAQHDLIAFTVLKACLNAGRPEEARRLLDGRRPGASGIAVSGIAEARAHGA